MIQNIKAMALTTKAPIRVFEETTLHVFENHFQNVTIVHLVVAMTYSKGVPPEPWKP